MRRTFPIVLVFLVVGVVLGVLLSERLQPRQKSRGQPWAIVTKQGERLPSGNLPILTMREGNNRVQLTDQGPQQGDGIIRVVIEEGRTTRELYILVPATPEPTTAD